MRDKGVTYSTVLDMNGEVAAQYGVRGIPNIVLIDPSGTIRYQGHQLPSVQEVEAVM